MLVYEIVSPASPAPPQGQKSLQKGAGPGQGYLLGGVGQEPLWKDAC